MNSLARSPGMIVLGKSLSWWRLLIVPLEALSAISVCDSPMPVFDIRTYKKAIADGNMSTWVTPGVRDLSPSQWHRCVLGRHQHYQWLVNSSVRARAPVTLTCIAQDFGWHLVLRSSVCPRRHVWVAKTRQRFVFQVDTRAGV